MRTRRIKWSSGVKRGPTRQYIWIDTGGKAVERPLDVISEQKEKE